MPQIKVNSHISVSFADQNSLFSPCFPAFPLISPSLLLHSLLSTPAARKLHDSCLSVVLPRLPLSAVFGELLEQDPEIFWVWGFYFDSFPIQLVEFE